MSFVGTSPPVPVQSTGKSGCQAAQLPDTNHQGNVPLELCPPGRPEVSVQDAEDNLSKEIDIGLHFIA